MTFFSWNEIVFLIKQPYDRILREESKEQHLRTVPKFCPNIYMI